MTGFESNKYELLRQIGQGGFGKVYLVQDKNTKEIKIIKIIESNKVWNHLIENQQILCGLSHENLMKVHGLEIIGEKRCVVLEYVRGENLNLFFYQNDLLLNDFIYICQGVLNALLYFSERNLVHKDIKPSNIVYDSQNKKVKIIDYDCLFINERNKDGYIGTLKYSAPEQILYNTTSTTSDIYSFGLVMCYMILGDVFFSKNIRETANCLKKETQTFITKSFKYDHQSAKSINSLIRGTLEFVPENRITVADAVKIISNLASSYETNNYPNRIIRDHNSVVSTEINKYVTASIISDEIVASFVKISTNRIISDSISFEGIQKHNKIKLPSWQYNVAEVTTQGGLPDSHESSKKEQRPSYYRKQLEKEYHRLSIQANIAFSLWVLSFIICFAIVFIAIYSFTKGGFIKGVITVILNGMILATQKMFTIREDLYKTQMEKMQIHLERGDYLDYAFEKADQLDDPKVKLDTKNKLIWEIREIDRQAHEKTS